MTIDQTFNFRRVSDRVTTSGLVNAEQLATLGGEGYHAVINLLPDSYEHAVHDEATIVRDQGLDYVYIPVDFAAPTHDDFAAFSDAMDAHSDDQVHVHCAANFRVSAFYGLYAQSRGSLHRSRSRRARPGPVERGRLPGVDGVHRRRAHPDGLTARRFRRSRRACPSRSMVSGILNTRSAFSRRNFGHTSSLNGTLGMSANWRSSVRPAGK